MFLKYFLSFLSFHGIIMLCCCFYVDINMIYVSLGAVQLHALLDEVYVCFSCYIQHRRARKLISNMFYSCLYPGQGKSLTYSSQLHNEWILSVLSGTRNETFLEYHQREYIRQVILTSLFKKQYIGFFLHPLYFKHPLVGTFLINKYSGQTGYVVFPYPFQVFP